MAYNLNAGHKLAVYNSTAYVPISECTNYSGWGKSVTEIDVSSHDDPSVKTINSGRIDYGSVTVTGNVVTGDPGQTFLEENAGILDANGGVFDFRYTLPGGTVHKYFKAHILSFADGDHNLEGIKTWTAVIRRVGPTATTDPHA